MEVELVCVCSDLVWWCGVVVEGVILGEELVYVVDVVKVVVVMLVLV